MLLKCKPNKLDAVLIICSSSTQLRSSHYYTNIDQFVQKAGHHNMTAAHATLAVNVPFLYTTILRPGGHAIVFSITSLFSFGVHIYKAIKLLLAILFA